ARERHGPGRGGGARRGPAGDRHGEPGRVLARLGPDPGRDAVRPARPRAAPRRVHGPQLLGRAPAGARRQPHRERVPDAAAGAALGADRGAAPGRHAGLPRAGGLAAGGVARALGAARAAAA
ncbi:hypothetical protein EG863_15515, partial [Enterococcus faecalis]